MCVCVLCSPAYARHTCVCVRYIISVGWDRRINVYLDNISDNLYTVARPAPPWQDDLENGHQEDILTIADCQPNYLATASYDGEIIVWNIVSGHVFCHLRAPPPRRYKDQSRTLLHYSRVARTPFVRRLLIQNFVYNVQTLRQVLFSLIIQNITKSLNFSTLPVLLSSNLIAEIAEDSKRPHCSPEHMNQPIITAINNHSPSFQPA